MTNHSLVHSSTTLRMTPTGARVLLPLLALLGACNDDGCGTQSNLSAPITAGAGLHTLTLDGYFSYSYGSYTVAITRP